MPLEEHIQRLAERLLQLLKEETGLDAAVRDETGAAVARRTAGSDAGDRTSAISHGSDREPATGDARASTSEGQCCPVVVGGRRIGAVEVFGPPEAALPAARLSALLLAQWAEEVQPSAAPSRSSSSEQGRRARVLLVHSSAWLRERIRQALPGSYELLVAGTRVEALAVARRESPDVLLCEEGAGLALQLLSSMKFEGDLSLVPFILVTDEPSGAEAVMESGAADLLSTSFSPVELRARVRAAVRSYRMYPELNLERKNLARTVRMLSRSQARTRATIESAFDGIVLLDRNGTVEALNGAAEEIFATGQGKAVGMDFVHNFIARQSRDLLAGALGQRLNRGAAVTKIADCEVLGLRSDGVEFPMECRMSRFETGAGASLCAFVRDLTETRRLQMELHQAQKLEAVGRLAAGIAHELNTPIQFIGDNTHFLKEAFSTLCAVVERVEELVPPEARAAIDAIEGDADMEFLREQAPRVFENTVRGVERVATIVRGMKEFAHPDRRDMVATDLNRGIQATLEVARNEYKYVADVETDLGELPSVTCYAGDVNQVFLNIIVNAAHAIAEAEKATNGRGRIRISTRCEDDHVVVAVSDTGSGIPTSIRDKIFDPFFTTKEVGRGTGQGLAIARTIVEKHRGSIQFETEPGRGTTFFIRLPVDGERHGRATD
ncbi:MAG TPA: ATP-binding protein [Anaeromyxobacteraceae bacterium]|nr:ATP-binding protein [Anaeromyxobacteraceae bacterium]